MGVGGARGTRELLLEGWGAEALLLPHSDLQGKLACHSSRTQFPQQSHRALNPNPPGGVAALILGSGWTLYRGYPPP